MSEGITRDMEDIVFAIFEPLEEVVLSRNEALRVQQNIHMFDRADANAMKHSDHKWWGDDFHIIVGATLAAKIRRAASEEPRIVWRNK